MKKIKKDFRKIMYLFISLFIIYIGSVTFIFLAKVSFESRLSLLLLISVLYLFIIFLMKPKIDYYIQLLKYLRLKENSSKPTKIKSSPFSKALINSLEKDGLKQSSKYNNFVIYYKVLKPHDYKIAKGGLLQAFIFITNPETSYNDPEISQAINFIEDSVAKKESFINYSIVIFRETQKFTKENLEETSVQVRFEKHRRTNVIVIPVLFNTSNNDIFYLNSTKSFPSRYYKFTLELINAYLT